MSTVPVWVLVAVGVALLMAGCYSVGETAVTVGWFTFGVLVLLWAMVRAAPERGTNGRP